MHAERQAIALGGKRSAHRLDVVRIIADDVQDRPEHFPVDLVERRQLDDRRPEERALSRAARRCRAARPWRRLFIFSRCASSSPRASASMIGPTSVAGSAGSPMTSTSIAPLIISTRLVRRLMRQEQQPQRRTPLPGRAEGRHHHIVHHLLAQRGRVAEHGVEPARLRDQRRDRAILRRQRAVDDARHLGRAGERDAAAARIARQPAADLAVAEQQMQRLPRQPRLVEQLHGLERDQRRLLRRLGEHGVARRQRAGDLAREDRQRKIPRARCRRTRRGPSSPAHWSRPQAPAAARGPLNFVSASTA